MPKTMLMPTKPSWWTWLTTSCLLFVGLAGWHWGFGAAVALSAAQTVVFLLREKSVAAYPAQIRVAFTLLLLVCLIPGMNVLFWLPALGTTALVLFGYCLMARILSLMPWNRTETLSVGLLRRTFLTPPVAGLASHGLPASGCPGGVCALEATAGAIRQ